MPRKRKKTRPFWSVTTKDGEGIQLSHHSEPNPRKRPDKTDAELFAEWEELQPKLDEKFYPNTFYSTVDEITYPNRERSDAIAKELGPKLMEMRQAKTEERLRKLENQSASFSHTIRGGGLVVGGVTDASNCVTGYSPYKKPWWNLTTDQVLCCVGIALTLAAVVIVALWA